MPNTNSSYSLDKYLLNLSTASDAFVIERLYDSLSPASFLKYTLIVDWASRDVPELISNHQDCLADLKPQPDLIKVLSNQLDHYWDTVFNTWNFQSAAEAKNLVYYKHLVAVRASLELLYPWALNEFDQVLPVWRLSQAVTETRGEARPKAE